jgi:hypothetical protein
MTQSTVGQEDTSTPAVNFQNFEREFFALNKANIRCGNCLGPGPLISAGRGGAPNQFGVQSMQALHKMSEEFPNACGQKSRVYNCLYATKNVVLAHEYASKHQEILGAPLFAFQVIAGEIVKGGPPPTTTKKKATLAKGQTRLCFGNTSLSTQSNKPSVQPMENISSSAVVVESMEQEAEAILDGNVIDNQEMMDMNVDADVDMSPVGTETHEVLESQAMPDTQDIQANPEDSSGRSKRRKKDEDKPTCSNVNSDGADWSTAAETLTAPITSPTPLLGGAVVTGTQSQRDVESSTDLETVVKLLSAKLVARESELDSLKAILKTMGASIQALQEKVSSFENPSIGPVQSNPNGSSQGTAQGSSKGIAGSANTVPSGTRHGSGNQSKNNVPRNGRNPQANGRGNVMNHERSPAENSNESQKPTYSYAKAAKKAQDRSWGERVKALAKKAVKAETPPMRFKKLHFQINDTRPFKECKNGGEVISLIWELLKTLKIRNHVLQVSKIGNQIIEIYIPEWKESKVRNALNRASLAVFQDFNVMAQVEHSKMNQDQIKERVVKRMTNLVYKAPLVNLRICMLNGFSTEIQQEILTMVEAKKVQAQSKGKSANGNRPLGESVTASEEVGALNDMSMDESSPSECCEEPQDTNTMEVTESNL